MHKLFIGIDPGKSGFITVYDSDSNDHVFAPMPKIGENIDVKGLADLFGIISHSGIIVHAVIEDVHAIYGSSASSTFTFGYVTGLLEMALVSNNIPFTKIQPKTWQKQMWQGVSLQQKSSTTGKTMVTNTKVMSITAAKRLFPNIDLRRTSACRVPDDNKVDSLLICEYCYKNFKR